MGCSTQFTPPPPPGRGQSHTGRWRAQQHRAASYTPLLPRGGRVKALRRPCGALRSRNRATNSRLKGSCSPFARGLRLQYTRAAGLSAFAVSSPAFDLVCVLYAGCAPRVRALARLNMWPNYRVVRACHRSDAFFRVTLGWLVQSAQARATAARRSARRSAARSADHPELSCLFYSPRRRLGLVLARLAWSRRFRAHTLERDMETRLGGSLIPE